MAALCLVFAVSLDNTALASHVPGGFPDGLSGLSEMTFLVCRLFLGFAKTFDWEKPCRICRAKYRSLDGRISAWNQQQPPVQQTNEIALLELTTYLAEHSNRLHLTVDCFSMGNVNSCTAQL